MRNLLTSESFSDDAMSIEYEDDDDAAAGDAVVGPHDDEDDDDAAVNEGKLKRFSFLKIGMCCMKQLLL